MPFTAIRVGFVVNARVPPTRYNRTAVLTSVQYIRSLLSKCHQNGLHCAGNRVVFRMEIRKGSRLHVISYFLSYVPIENLNAAVHFVRHRESYGSERPLQGKSPRALPAARPFRK